LHRPIPDNGNGRNIIGELADKSVWNRFGRIAKQYGAKHRGTGSGESTADEAAKGCAEQRSEATLAPEG